MVNSPYRSIQVLAKDSKGVSVIAGLVQDSLFPISDTKYDKNTNTFVMVVNRFSHESAGNKPPFIRTHSLLYFSDVVRVSLQDIDKTDENAYSDRIYDLLSIIPVQEGINRYIFLTLAGGSVIRLSVESINIVLQDVGDAWETNSKPCHENSDLTV